MRLREWVAPLAAPLAAACVYATPQPRTPTPGEEVALDAVAFEAPRETGWLIDDLSQPDRRIVNLLHVTPDGDWDRRAWVEEHVRPPVPVTPDELLDRARRGLPASDARAVVTPAPEKALELDERFGPLSVRGRVTVVPSRGYEDTILRGVLHVREFVPPSRPDRFYRAVWIERAPDAGLLAAEDGARSFMGSLRARPPDLLVTPAGVEEHLSFVLAIGPEVASLRGERLVGGAFRFGVDGDTLFPRARTGKGLGIDTRLFFGVNDQWAAYSGTVGVDVHASRGRLRYGAGLEIGYGQLMDVEAQRAIHDLILGPRASAAIDLARFTGRKGVVDLSLELSAGAATPGFYRGSAVLSMRMSDRRR